MSWTKHLRFNAAKCKIMFMSGTPCLHHLRNWMKLFWTLSSYKYLGLLLICLGPLTLYTNCCNRTHRPLYRVISIYRKSGNFRDTKFSCKIISCIKIFVACWGSHKNFFRDTFLTRWLAPWNSKDPAAYVAYEAESVPLGSGVRLLAWSNEGEPSQSAASTTYLQTVINARWSNNSMKNISCF